MMHRVVVLALVVASMTVMGCDQSPASKEKKSSMAKAASPKAARSAAAQKPPAKSTQRDRAANPPQPATASGPQWACDQLLIDFGEVWEGETVQREFTFRNTGNAVLIVDKPTAHCSCSTAPNWTKEVPPGGTGVISFQLETKNKAAGLLHERLNIKSNATNKQTDHLWLKGVIRDACLLEIMFDAQYEKELAAGGDKPPRKKQKVSFGKALPNERVHRVIKLTKMGGQPLSLMMLPIIPTNTPFKIDFRETKPMEEFELTVSMDPPLPVGRHRARIRFKTNVPERPMYQLWAYLHVPPRVEIQPDLLILGTAQDKYPRDTWQIRFTNHGETPFEIVSIATSEPRYDISLKPRDPARPKMLIILIGVPGGADYRPPPYGEVIEIKTNDPEFPKYRLTVRRDARRPLTPRPADKPLVMNPVELQ